MIQIRYFAAVREALGAAEEQLDPAGVATVADVRAALRDRDAAHAEALDPGRRLLCAVNQAYAADDTPVADGDEVAFFPPVTGG